VFRGRKTTKAEKWQNVIAANMQKTLFYRGKHTFSRMGRGGSITKARLRHNPWRPPRENPQKSKGGD
jgi:hypothetical protein